MPPSCWRRHCDQNAKELTAIYKGICRENGMMTTPDECFRYMGEFPERQSQISIYDL